MLNLPIILLGKSLSKVSSLLNLGNGTTWPGHIALKLNSNFAKEILEKNKHIKIIFVVGTNGKTTTTSLLNHLLTKDNKRVLQNTSGANLINGISSSLLLHSDIFSSLNTDIILFELDENALPQALKTVTPNAIILLNLFRDQLDRYGEVNTIAKRWKESLDLISKPIDLYINSDDPLVAFIAYKSNHIAHYFGIDGVDNKKIDEYSSDTNYCPNCTNKLLFKKRFFSHLGIWECTNCSFDFPKQRFITSSSYPLDGAYNQYNINAAVLVAKDYGVRDIAIDEGLKTFEPVFGRQEKTTYKNKDVAIVLAKNPTGFSQAVQVAIDKGSKDLLLILNDNIADGTDVSWIWDVDFSILKAKKANITISGKRAYDLSLRLKYDDIEIKNFISLPEALKHAVAHVSDKNTLYILSTYTAMLEVRKLITGKKIL